MDDLGKMRFWPPPGIFGSAYADIIVSAIATEGSDIPSASENGTIDAAE